MRNEYNVIVENIKNSECLKGKEERFVKCVLNAIDNKDEMALNELSTYKKYSVKSPDASDDNISKFINNLCKKIEAKYNL